MIQAVSSHDCRQVSKIEQTMYLSFSPKATSGLPAKDHKFLRPEDIVSTAADQMEDELLSVPVVSGSLPVNMLAGEEKNEKITLEWCWW